MTTQPLSEVKAHLSDYVRRASVEHEHITITVNGRSAAMLIGVEEWESIEETLFWLSQPGIHEDLAEARANPGSGISSEEMAAYIAERRRAEGE